MKSNRKKWLLPIVAFSIAIAGAFASNIETKKDTLVWGYLDHTQPCTIKVACGEGGMVACTSGGQTAKGLNAFETSCDRYLTQYIPGQ